MSGRRCASGRARPPPICLDEDPRVAVVLAEISTGPVRSRARRASGPRRERRHHGADVGRASPPGSRWRGSCPIVHTITPFLVERPLEQIKLDFGYQGLQGTFVSVGGSYDYTSEGFTHHSPGDVQVMLTVPGMQVAGARHGGRARAAAPRDVRERPASRTFDRARRRTRSRGRSRSADSRSSAGGARHGRRGGADARPHARRGRGHGCHGALRHDRVRRSTRTGSRARRPDGPDVIVGDAVPGGDVHADAHRRRWPLDRARFTSIGVGRDVLREYGTVADHDRARGLDERGIRERIARILDGSARRTLCR